MKGGGLQRFVAPIARRALLAVGRAVVELVNDGTKLQSLQVSLLADELADNVERFQQYGFTSVPHAGAEAVALSVGGARDHLVVVAVDDRRYRITGLKTGELAIHTDEDCSIKLLRGRVVEIKASKVKIDAPLLEVTGSIEAAGNVKSGNIVLGTHRHTGVQTGGGTTGGPTP